MVRTDAGNWWVVPSCSGCATTPNLKYQKVRRPDLGMLQREPDCRPLRRNTTIPWCRRMPAQPQTRRQLTRASRLHIVCPGQHRSDSAPSRRPQYGKCPSMDRHDRLTAVGRVGKGAAESNIGQRTGRRLRHPRVAGVATVPGGKRDRARVEEEADVHSRNEGFRTQPRPPVKYSRLTVATCLRNGQKPSCRCAPRSGSPDTNDGLSLLPAKHSKASDLRRPVPLCPLPTTGPVDGRNDCAGQSRSPAQARLSLHSLSCPSDQRCSMERMLNPAGHARLGEFAAGSDATHWTSTRVLNKPQTGLPNSQATPT